MSCASMLSWRWEDKMACEAECNVFKGCIVSASITSYSSEFITLTIVDSLQRQNVKGDSRFEEVCMMINGGRATLMSRQNIS